MFQTGTTGSRIEVPQEWVELFGVIRDHPQASQLWMLRVVSGFDYSAAQAISAALDLATPLVYAGGSFEGVRALIVRWLDGSELSGEHKAAVVAAWRRVDRAGFAAAASDLGVSPIVRMLLQGGR